MSERLKQTEWEELSAYVDGELTPDRAEQIRLKVETSPVWANALAELRALDARLDVWTPPEPPADLAERIVLSVPGKRHRRVVAFRRVLAATAAVAAAVVIAMLATRLDTKTAVDDSPRTADSEQYQPRDTTEAPAETVDEFAVENLGFFRDYDVLEDFETLRAIERLEQSGSSGT
ncbi:MAG: anti-sigma factor family protein [Phycisphaerae bacterium]